MIYSNSDKRSKSWRGREIRFVVPGETVGGIVSDGDFKTAVGASYKETNGTLLTCVYFDTNDMANYQQMKWHRRRHFRILHQSGDSYMSLERTTNSSDQLKIRRTSLHLSVMERITAPSLAGSCKGSWFFKRLKQRHLKPVCKVSFTRVFHSESRSDDKSVVSIDSNFVCETASGMSVSPVTNGKPLFSNFAIVTVSYSNLFPLVAKRLMCQLQLSPSTVSIYRKAISTCIPLSKANNENATCLTDGGSSDPLRPLTNSLNCDATSEDQYA